MPKPVANPETGEPLRMGALVADKDGDVWKRGRTLWTCQTPLDGRRVTNVGRLPWHALKGQYGPLAVMDLNDRST